MLVSFSVRNFKSFKDLSELSMVPANINENNGHLIHNAALNSEYLPTAVIYGPNGGGKSNFLLAMKALLNYLITPVLLAQNEVEVSSTRMKEMRTKITPFSFKKECLEQPTEFEIVFDGELAEYKYFLSFQNGLVLSESLYQIKYSTGRSSLVFERTGSKIKKGRDLKGIPISEELSDTISFLTFCGISHRKNSVISDVMNWLCFGIDFINFGIPLDEALLEIAEFQLSDEQRISKISSIISHLDLDIDSLRLDKTNLENPQIYTRHKVGNEIFELNLNDESRGTKKLFTLLPYLMEAIEKGKTLVIDEMDAKMHPRLLQFIISLFTNPETNPNGAQLIFTSQDIISMNADNFRRDEIWFSAKNMNEESQLYSLADFKDENDRPIRKDAVYFKQYLEGKYGADPFIERIERWESLGEEK